MLDPFAALSLPSLTVKAELQPWDKQMAFARSKYVQLTPTICLLRERLEEDKECGNVTMFLSTHQGKVLQSAKNIPTLWDIS